MRIFFFPPLKHYGHDVYHPGVEIMTHSEKEMRGTGYPHRRL